MGKKTILVIDDAVEVTKILKFHLAKKYNVLEAHDGEEGLKKIYDQHPDLAILDINMPKMDGIAVYNRLSAATGKPLLPVIILTVREELGKLFKDMDVDGFVTKPFDIENILKEVDTVMAKRYGLPETEALKQSLGQKKVLIVESDPSVFNQITVAFLNAGYTVYSTRSGMGAIEKIITDLPDLIVIKLGLPDISGDLVCVKLKQMPKTMDIPFVLYAPKKSELDRAVVNKICGIIKANLVESDEPEVLLKEAELALNKQAK